MQQKNWTLTYHPFRDGAGEEVSAACFSARWRRIDAAREFKKRRFAVELPSLAIQSPSSGSRGEPCGNAGFLFPRPERQERRQGECPHDQEKPPEVGHEAIGILPSAFDVSADGAHCSPNRRRRAKYLSILAVATNANPPAAHQDATTKGPGRTWSRPPNRNCMVATTDTSRTNAPLSWGAVGQGRLGRRGGESTHRTLGQSGS